MEGEHPSARKRGQRVGIPIYFVIEQSSLYARYPTPIKWKNYREIPIKENRNSCIIPEKGSCIPTRFVEQIKPQ